MKTACDIAAILLEVDIIDFWEDGSKAMMCNLAHEGFDNFRKYKALMCAVNEIALAKASLAVGLMINKLGPGVIVPKHSDNVPGRPKRWHLPLVTNPLSWWWAEHGGKKHFPLGVWVGPVPYWSQHQVGNEGITERIHLVVDLQ